jgi:pentatricopeptide repeat protein
MKLIVTILIKGLCKGGNWNVETFCRIKMRGLIEYPL